MTIKWHLEQLMDAKHGIINKLADFPESDVPEDEPTQRLLVKQPFSNIVNLISKVTKILFIKFSTTRANMYFKSTIATAPTGYLYNEWEYNFGTALYCLRPRDIRVKMDNESASVEILNTVGGGKTRGELISEKLRGGYGPMKAYGWKLATREFAEHYASKGLVPYFDDVILANTDTEGRYEIIFTVHKPIRAVYESSDDTLYDPVIQWTENYFRVETGEDSNGVYFTFVHPAIFTEPETTPVFTTKLSNIVYSSACIYTADRYAGGPLQIYPKPFAFEMIPAAANQRYGFSYEGIGGMLYIYDMTAKTFKKAYTLNGSYEYDLKAISFSPNLKATNRYRFIFSGNFIKFGKGSSDISPFAEAVSIINPLPKEFTNGSYMFENSTLSSIPSDLFSRCKENLESTMGMFKGCESITSIPNGLLDGCVNLTDVSSMFMNSGVAWIPPLLFYGLSSLSDASHCFDSIPINGDDIPEDILVPVENNLKYAEYMFANCWSTSTALTGNFSNHGNVKINMTGYYFNLKSISYMFYGSKFRTIHLNANGGRFPVMEQAQGVCYNCGNTQAIRISFANGTAPAAGCNIMYMAYNCTYSTQITVDLGTNFEVNNVGGVFCNSTSFTNAVPEWWNSSLFPNVSSALHSMTFRNALNASNYSSIPSDWK